MDIAQQTPLALVTGVDRALGREVARLLVDAGHEVVTAVEADLATRDGVEALHARLAGAARPLTTVSLNVEIRRAATARGDQAHTLDLGMRGAISLAERCLDGLLAAGGALLVTTRCAPGDPSLAHLCSFLAGRQHADPHGVAPIALRFDPSPDPSPVSDDGAEARAHAADAPASAAVAAMAQEALVALRGGVRPRREGVGWS